VKLRAGLGIGLVAACALALQVLLSRVLSAVLAYHFSFLAISLALLGVGAGALVVYLRPAWGEPPVEPRLARWCALLAASVIVVALPLVRLDYSAGLATDLSSGFVVTLALVCVLTAVPFCLAGAIVALVVRTYVRWIGRIYACDLAGAAIGALVAVPLMWIVPGTTLLVGLALLPAGAAVLFGGARTLALGAAALAALAVVLAATTPLYDLPPHTTVPAGLQPVKVRWTPLSRVIGYPPPRGATIAPIFYDRVYAPVPVRRPGGPLPDWRALSLGPQSIGYALGGPGRALVIGGGGGRDIENALSSGRRRVDVVELNQAIRDVVDRDMARWSGSPYSLPGVSVAIGDGRSTLARRDTPYGVIHIGFTDTLSANSGAGFALCDAMLYSLEA
jgi:hypothetical protein